MSRVTSPDAAEGWARAVAAQELVSASDRQAARRAWTLWAITLVVLTLAGAAWWAAGACALLGLLVWFERRGQRAHLAAEAQAPLRYLVRLAKQPDGIVTVDVQRGPGEDRP